MFNYEQFKDGFILKVKYGHILYMRHPDINTKHAINLHLILHHLCDVKSRAKAVKVETATDENTVVLPAAVARQAARS